MILKRQDQRERIWMEIQKQLDRLDDILEQYFTSHRMSVKIKN
jgi:hypothetical protein